MMINLLKCVFGISSLFFAANFAYAICVMCPGEGRCALVDGNGFLNCSQGTCSGNCYGTAPTTGGGGGWYPPPPMPGSGGNDFPEDECEYCQSIPVSWLTNGKWDSFIQTLPDVEPVEKGVYFSASCDTCKPEVKGPVLKIADRYTAHREAGKNWLLTQALIRFAQTAEHGVSDTGAFWFTVPGDEKQKQAVLDGVDLAIPRDQLKGFSGLATYRTTQPAEKLLAADVRYIEVEMKVWQVNNRKGVPVQGLSSLLRFEKAEKSGAWELTVTKIDEKMPAPNLVFFPNLKKHGKALAQFAKKQ